MPNTTATTGFTPDELARLPKWARERAEEIGRLVVSLEERAREQDGQVEDPHVFVLTDYIAGHGFDYRPVAGKHARVVLTNKPHDRSYDDGFEVRRDSDGLLEVQTRWGGLIVEPVSSNYVRIRAIG